MIDERALERIVREVVERILREHPEILGHPPAEDRIYPHAGQVLTEDDLIRCRKQGKRVIRLYKDTLITPLARDRARDLSIDLLVRDERRPRRGS